MGKGPFSAPGPAPALREYLLLKVRVPWHLKPMPRGVQSRLGGVLLAGLALWADSGRQECG